MCYTKIYQKDTWKISPDMIEGYAFGTISTLIILLIGLIVFCVCHQYKRNGKRRRRRNKYQKVVNIDTTDDERIVINQ